MDEKNAKELGDALLKRNDEILRNNSKDKKYELINTWEERVRSLEGMLVVVLLYGFLMFFAGFLLGTFFMVAGG